MQYFHLLPATHFFPDFSCAGHPSLLVRSDRFADVARNPLTGLGTCAITTVPTEPPGVDAVEVSWDAGIRAQNNAAIVSALHPVFATGHRHLAID